MIIVLSTKYSTVQCFTVLDPVISVTNHTTPYNGTNFTLTGVIQLSESIDTDVTVFVAWSPGSYSQVPVTPPYLTNLIFQPLATNSSRNLTLTVTIQPTDNSVFIMPTNTSITYNLVVMRE